MPTYAGRNKVLQKQGATNESKRGDPTASVTSMNKSFPEILTDISLHQIPYNCNCTLRAFPQKQYHTKGSCKYLLCSSPSLTILNWSQKLHTKLFIHHDQIKRAKIEKNRRCYFRMVLLSKRNPNDPAPYHIRIMSDANIMLRI